MPASLGPCSSAIASEGATRHPWGQVAAQFSKALGHGGDLFTSHGGDLRVDGEGRFRWLRLHVLRGQWLGI